MGGAAFTWGLEKGYVITPWWLLGIIAAMGAVPIWYLVEMPGFSKTDDSDEDEDVDGDEEEDLLPTVDEDVAGEILEGDEILQDETALDTVDGPPLNRAESRKSLADGSEPRSRKNSGGTADFLAVPGSYGSTRAAIRDRRSSIDQLERRMSSPIGVRGGSVGPGGGRRLSNGLAASNSGHGIGGTSFA